MPTVAAVVEFLERLAPPALAADWDNVGLLLGERTAEVRRLMTCLTVTPDSAAEAVAEGAGLVVTHHPILFRAIKRLTDATVEGRMLLALARAGVAVYSPHTAYDDASEGINALLARRLGLGGVGPLRRRDDARMSKVVVFTPEKDLQRVSDAMFAAGAGRIGQYSECSFRLAGMGTFFGSEATHPTVGQKGRREEAPEWRLEAVCPEGSVDAVTAAIRRAHSYEEPAFDVYPLRPAASGLGSGRLGALPEPRPLRAFAEAVRAALELRPGAGDRRSAKGGEPGGRGLRRRRRAAAGRRPRRRRRAADRRGAVPRLPRRPGPGIGPGAAGALRHRALRRRRVGGASSSGMAGLAGVGEPARSATRPDGCKSGAFPVKAGIRLPLP